MTKIVIMIIVIIITTISVSKAVEPPYSRTMSIPRPYIDGGW